MNPAPTRKRSPSHEAQPARWRALRTAGAALPRAPREQGGAPAVVRPPAPRANLPPRGPQPDKAARWMAATAPPCNGARAVCRLPCKTAPRAPPKAIPRTPTGRGSACLRLRRRPAPGLPLAFATLGDCHCLGQAGDRARGARPQLGCPSAPACRSGAPRLWPRAWGCAGCGAKGPTARRTIASAANRVLCSRRLYIVQSRQRRKTGHVKGGND
jgi:hypothetical protein